MIIQKPSTNRMSRAGHEVLGVVIHIVDGLNTNGEMDAYFQNPNSKASAHYLVQRNGEIHQYVDEQDAAMHVGVVKHPSWKLIKKNVSPNLYTVGIEHEGIIGDALTDAQRRASAELIANICRRWELPVNKDHVIPHHAIRKSKACPGAGVSVDELIRLADSKGE